jgi:chemotaxis family two-component system response regulator Rcp1
MDRSVVVLLVEDSPADRLLTTEVLKETGLSITLCCVESGEEALAYLRGQGEHAEASRPDVVLLDLGLPQMKGQEVLAEMKNDETLRSVPVVVLTSDDDDRTLVDTLGLGAHEFATKPLDREQITAVIDYVTEFA